MIVVGGNFSLCQKCKEMFWPWKVEDILCQNCEQEIVNEVLEADDERNSD